jgi:hypothetical protein
MQNLWWILADVAIFVVVLMSEPPQLWFWLVVFVVILLYGIEQSIH